ncbi:hypothetical protein N9896_00425 [bacterium]|nr:hypothetical protein [bacterium]
MGLCSCIPGKPDAFYHPFCQWTYPFYFPLGGFFAGLIIGFVVSRIHKITWDEDGEVIITKIDSVGLLILLGYVSFIFFKNRILEDIVHLHNIGTISMAVLSGTMLGHAIALRKRIARFYFKKTT